ncbi:hypothetical protein HSB1_19480 [Halogranum salarium B-1]|uniref:Uncharacterized protein n=2 Tax=Halogranum rubrum TaxID=553466 RepID=J2ZGI4_9EURY|nr:hypothetical protein HSB1_19480 [Halogranum salarium B-1]
MFMSNSVKVSEFDYESDDEGNLVVTATLRNESDETATVTLIASVTAGKGKNEREVDQSEQFELAKDASADAAFTFDVPYTRFERNGGLDLEVHPA